MSTGNRLRLMAVASVFTACLLQTAGAGIFDAWTSSMKVTFNYNDFEPLTNFPALVVLGPAVPGFSYGQFASGSGADLRFADESGNEIPYEIEKWDTSGNSYVWVRIPRLMGKGNTNYFDCQWLSDWSWNGQTIRARRHSNGQVFAEKVEQNSNMSYWQFKPQRYADGAPGFDGNAPMYYFRQFALGDPRTGWSWPNPILMSFPIDSVVATFTNFWENPVTYEHAIARYNNGYWWLQSQESGRLIWSGEAAQAKSDFLSSYSNAERCAQAALFMDFNPNDPHNPAWANNYTSMTSYAGLNTRTALTSVTVYWGNSAASQPAYATNGSVWSANYVGVWHMGQANAKDSTRRIADGAGSGASVTAGRAGDGVSFTGSSRIDFGTVNIGFSGHAAYAVEAWVKRTSTGSGPDVSYGNTSAGSSFSIGTDGSGNYRNIHHFANSDRTYGRLYANGQWEHIVFNYYPNNRDVANNNFTEHLYINGEWVGCADRSGTDLANVPSSGPLKFGQESWGSAYCGSLVLDEVRISKTVRMHNWQKCSYLTVASNGSFTTYGTVQSQEPPVVAAGSEWLYHNNGQVPDPDWKSRLFPDGGWLTGAAPLGYGSDSPQIATVLGYGGVDSNRWVTYYFRKHFTVTDASAVSGMVINLQYDDGAAIYLNGTLVAVTNMPGTWGNVTYALDAAPENSGTYQWVPFNISVLPLVDGDNVLAVEIHQNSPTSSDVYFDLSLAIAGSGGTLPPVQSNATVWTAYNDFVANTGEPVTAISTHAAGVSGALIDYSTGTPLPVQVAMTVDGGSVSTTADAPAPSAGSDALTVFDGKVGLTGCNTLGQGTLTMTFSGLDPAGRYSFVLYASRGYTNYTYRWQTTRIGGVAGFINRSSSGATVSTALAQDDTTKILAANTEGRVFRYDDIQPGAGGTFTITVAGGATPGSSTNAYVNSFMLGTYSASTNVDAFGVPDSWKVDNFATTNVDMSADADGDDLTNLDEYIAGCDPRDEASVPQVAAIGLSGGLVQFAFNTVSQRVYSVDYRTNLLSGTWLSLATNIAGDGAQEIVSVGSTNTMRYYRFRVRLED